MQNVFATAGGYMQMLNALFSLLSALANKISYDYININDLFVLDTKNNRIIIKDKKQKNFYKKNIYE